MWAVLIAKAFRSLHWELLWWTLISSFTEINNRVGIQKTDSLPSYLGCLLGDNQSIQSNLLLTSWHWNCTMNRCRIWTVNSDNHALSASWQERAALYIAWGVKCVGIATASPSAFVHLSASVYIYIWGDGSVTIWNSTWCGRGFRALSQTEWVNKWVREWVS